MVLIYHQFKKLDDPSLHRIIYSKNPHLYTFMQNYLYRLSVFIPDQK
jgi:hypothetical protein